ncbi:MAG: ribonuclease P protein component [Actinomycetota bacterium]
MASLRSRGEWQRIFREGASCPQGGLVVHVLLRAERGAPGMASRPQAGPGGPRPEEARGANLRSREPKGPRLGMVVSRRVGKAVERNRLRRRLRAAWQSLAPDLRPEVDCVVVARPQAAREKFQQLSADLSNGLRSLGGFASLSGLPGQL